MQNNMIIAHHGGVDMLTEIVQALQLLVVLLLEEDSTQFFFRCVFQLNLLVSTMATGDDIHRPLIEPLFGLRLSSVSRQRETS